MTWLRSVLLAGNACLLALVLAALAAPAASAQNHITGPSSIKGTCCRTHVEGGGFCCTSCCLGPKTCISDFDPACQKSKEAQT